MKLSRFLVSWVLGLSVGLAAQGFFGIPKWFPIDILCEPVAQQLAAKCDENSHEQERQLEICRGLVDRLDWRKNSEGIWIKQVPLMCPSPIANNYGHLLVLECEEPER